MVVVAFMDNGALCMYIILGVISLAGSPCKNCDFSSGYQDALTYCR